MGRLFFSIIIIDQKLLTIDSMQGTTADDVANGATYLKIMEDNLAVLKEALN